MNGSENTTTTPIVLLGVEVDPEHVRRMLDGLVAATSWTCDQRSQIPTLRFETPSGESMIIAMEGARIHGTDADRTNRREDGSARMADRLRLASIACLKRAMLPIESADVEEFERREQAYSLLVAHETGHDFADDPEAFVQMATPWRTPTRDRLDDIGAGSMHTTTRVEAPMPELSPVGFVVSTGDSGSMRSRSLGLYGSSSAARRMPDALDRLRIETLLRSAWRT